MENGYKNYQSILAFILAVGCSPTVTTSTRDQSEGLNSGKSILETARSAGTFNTLLTALEAAGLEHTLEEEGPFTVFAPTDAAFAKIPQDTLVGLLNNPTQLRAILLWHVFYGEITSQEVAAQTKIYSVSDQGVRVFAQSSLRLNNAQIESSDIQTSNGIIHVIDSVISIPPDLTNLLDPNGETGNFFTLAAQSGVDAVLANAYSITVFIPRNAVFTNAGNFDFLFDNPDIARDVLLAHAAYGEVRVEDATTQIGTYNIFGDFLPFGLLPDGTVLVDGAAVVTADQFGSNGVIHVMDGFVGQ